MSTDLRNASSLLFRFATLVVFLQIALGGLVTFNFIAPASHIATGFAALAIALATMIVSLVSKPSSKSVQMTAIAMFLLIAIQIPLGFVTLQTGNSVIAWVHFLDAMAIFGAAISGSFAAVRWEKVSRSVPRSALSD